MMNTVIVELCTRVFMIPLECPCCGSEPDAEAVITRKAGRRRVASDTARQLAFPYCTRCVEHVAASETGSMRAAVVILLGVASGMLAGMLTRFQTGVFVFLWAIPVAWVLVAAGQRKARSRSTSSCVSPHKAIAYFGWSGSTSLFSFESPMYTARFAEQNAATLVSVTPELRQLLEAHKVARLQVPTPASATRVVPPPLDAPGWLAFVQRQTRTVARRIALMRALDSLQDIGDRQAVVAAVCRAELAELLVEVSSLPASTRKRRLRDALTKTRADNLPPDLAEAKVRELEALL
jgi:hypothetical protein